MDFGTEAPVINFQKDNLFCMLVVSILKSCCVFSLACGVRSEHSGSDTISKYLFVIDVWFISLCSLSVEEFEGVVQNRKPKSPTNFQTVLISKILSLITTPTQLRFPHNLICKRPIDLELRNHLISARNSFFFYLFKPTIYYLNLQSTLKVIIRQKKIYKTWRGTVQWQYPINLFGW